MKNIFVGKNAPSLTIKTNMTGYGYVYAIEFEHGLVKIGMTKNPKSRVNGFENCVGIKLKNVAVTIPHRNFRQNERISHLRFDSDRKRGEWFDVDFMSVVNFIESLDFEEESNDEYNIRVSLENDINNSRFEYAKRVAFSDEVVDYYDNNARIPTKQELFDVNSKEFIVLNKIKCGIAAGNLLGVPLRITHREILNRVFVETGVDYSYLIKYINYRVEESSSELQF